MSGSKIGANAYSTYLSRTNRCYVATIPASSGKVPPIDFVLRGPPIWTDCVRTLDTTYKVDMYTIEALRRQYVFQNSVWALSDFELPPPT